MQLTEVRVYLFFCKENYYELFPFDTSVTYTKVLLRELTWRSKQNRNYLVCIRMYTGLNKKKKKSQIIPPLPYLNKKEEKKNISKYFVNLPGLAGRLVLSKQFEN